VSLLHAIEMKWGRDVNGTSWRDFHGFEGLTQFWREQMPGSTTSLFCESGAG